MPSRQLTVTSMLLALVVIITVDNCQCETQPSTSPFIEDGLAYQVRQVNGGRKINSFVSYKDVVLTEYNMPAETLSAIFGFSANSNQKNCSADKTVVVFLQHGGFPLFTVGNATFARNVYSNRSDPVMLEFPALDGVSPLKLTLPVPREGRWFSAVFIKEAASHVKQAGLFARCDTSYVSSFLTSAYQDPVIKLSSGEKRTFTSATGAPAHQLFKMCLTEGRYDAVDVLVHCTDGCPLTVKARSDGLPTNPLASSAVFSVVCQTGPCSLTYTPIQDTCQYIYAEFEENITTSFAITVTAVRCRKPVNRFMTEADMVPKKKRSQRDRHEAQRQWNRKVEIDNGSVIVPDVALTNESFYHESGDSKIGLREQPTCPYIVHMGRLDISSSFTTSFGLNHDTWPSVEYLFLPKSMFSDSILTFDILPYRDTGGTLHVALNLTNAAAPDLVNFTVVACLNLGQGSRFNIEQTCQGPVLKLNATQLHSDILIPYPEIGTWNLNIQGSPSAGSDISPTTYIQVQLTAKLDQCVKGSCGQYGTCRVVLNSGILITSACVCSAGWKGWDCQDGSEADSYAQLIMSVVFLTISNLVFIPAAYVAYKRQYYTEAVVYISTCFFSGFYHACDQPLKRYALCIMDYGVLQFCDFYVSILSFWVTIVAMADLPAHLRSMAHMVGCIGVALGVEYEKTGIWVFAVPAVTASIILAISWGFRSYRMRKLIPQKRYWLIHFAPGFVLSAIGLIIFAFVETKSNYKFVHSVWHMLMAGSVICFLPPSHCRLDGKYPKLRAIGTESDLSTTSSTSSTLSQDLLTPRRTDSASPLSRLS